MLARCCTRVCVSFMLVSAIRVGRIASLAALICKFSRCDARAYLPKPGVVLGRAGIGYVYASFVARGISFFL